MTVYKIYWVRDIIYLVRGFTLLTLIVVYSIVEENAVMGPLSFSLAQYLALMHQ